MVREPLTIHTDNSYIIRYHRYAMFVYSLLAAPCYANKYVLMTLPVRSKTAQDPSTHPRLSSGKQNIFKKCFLFEKLENIQ